VANGSEWLQGVELEVGEWHWLVGKLEGASFSDGSDALGLWNSIKRGVPYYEGPRQGLEKSRFTINLTEAEARLAKSLLRGKLR
jgi:hypothetical protein